MPTPRSPSPEGRGGQGVRTRRFRREGARVINEGASLHPVGFNALTDHELATMFRVLFSSP